MTGLLNAHGVIGWWFSTEDGAGLQPIDTGILWGDGPADIMDAALAEIRQQFRETWHP
jgi:hypothetical protein